MSRGPPETSIADGLTTGTCPRCGTVTPLGKPCLQCRFDASAEAAGGAALGKGEAQFPGFTVLRRIGAGGMGEVLQAHPEGHGASQRDLRALKVIRRELVGDSRAERLLDAEVIAVQRIVHPRVVRVLGSGRATDGRAFLVMEWLDGRSLADALADPACPFGDPAHPQLPAYAAFLVRQLGAALDAAHAQEVLHRDVKPSNVMLVQEPNEGEEVSAQTLRAKLIDFGIARLGGEAHTGQSASVALGTVEHMAPEVARGEATTVRTDVYLLAQLMYRVLTGLRRTTGTPKMPSRVNARYGRDLDDIVVIDGLADDPQDRPESAGALAERLAGLLDDVAATEAEERRRAAAEAQERRQEEAGAEERRRAGAEAEEQRQEEAEERQRAEAEAEEERRVEAEEERRAEALAAEAGSADGPAGGTHDDLDDPNDHRLLLLPMEPADGGTRKAVEPAWDRAQAQMAGEATSGNAKSRPTRTWWVVAALAFMLVAGTLVSVLSASPALAPIPVAVTVVSSTEFTTQPAEKWLVPMQVVQQQPKPLFGEPAKMMRLEDYPGAITDDIAASGGLSDGLRRRGLRDGWLGWSVVEVGYDAIRFPGLWGGGWLGEVKLSSGAVHPAEMRGHLISPLFDQLKEWADEHKAVAEGTPTGVLPFEGRLLLVVAPTASVGTLRDVLYTAGQAQFDQLAFLTSPSDKPRPRTRAASGRRSVNLEISAEGREWTLSGIAGGSTRVSGPDDLGPGLDRVLGERSSLGCATLAPHGDLRFGHLADALEAFAALGVVPTIGGFGGEGAAAAAPDEEVATFEYLSGASMPGVQAPEIRLGVALSVLEIRLPAVGPPRESGTRTSDECGRTNPK